MSTNGRLRRGFTLVELLVVITIIGILIALLLPAVQAAREAARKMQCSNNIKQLALGCLQHEHANGKFPSGGWTYYWAGDATRGFGKKQPGSWLYSILPYIDELPLFQMSASDPFSQKLVYNGTESAQGAVIMCATPLTVMNCPTRRASVVYAIGLDIHNPPGAHSNSVVKGDYAGNAGDEMWADSYRVCMNGPTSLAAGDAWFATPGTNQWGADSRTLLTSIPIAWGPTPYNGIIFQNSEVTMGMIQDGTSNTYLVGEKYCCPNYYATSTDSADTETYYNGDDNDNQRSAWNAPLQDTPDYYPSTMTTLSLYGSAHETGINMAFCDGSVHQIAYTIDSHIPGAIPPKDGPGYIKGQFQDPSKPMFYLGVHQRLANRCDGWSVDGSSF